MLEKKINQDYITAMKAKDSLRSSTLNFLRAQLKNILIEKRVESLDDQDVVTVIKKQVKSRQDSIEQYTQGGRQDLVDKETAELAVLKEYLPEEMPEEELKKLVNEAVAEIGASSMKDMGQVMKVVIEKSEGRADNKVVSGLVKEKLASL